MARSSLGTRARAADNKLQAWRSALAGRIKAITTQPEPRAIGSAARARQMEAGNFLFNGELVEAPNLTIWDVPQPSIHFTFAVHGFEWLDDFAAATDPKARALAQEWLWLWIDRYGAARGPGWYPHLTGRRLIRWISHAPFVLKGRERAESHKFFKSLGRQVAYLAHAWPDAAQGLPRIEALTGLIYAAISLEGAEGLLKGARRGLSKACASLGPDGGVRSRNPEELLEVFTALIWAAHAQREAGHAPDQAHLDAIERIAPTLRGLRLGDGALARFNGGGRGAEGLLDLSLAESGVRSAERAKTMMGYARLASGRTVVVMDAAAPPSGPDGLRSHAGTLSFEMTSGRRPLIVNQGPGDAFGADWRERARETAAHSTVEIDASPMAQFTPLNVFGRADGATLTEGPQVVAVERAVDRSGFWALGTHDGYSAGFGLHHERRLFMSPDGSDLRGEDTLSAQSSRERARFARRREQGTLPWRTRFHIHPDVETSLDLGGEAVSLALPSGEVWVFRQSGGELSLEPSTYLDRRRLNPRLTQQIVVTAEAMDYASRINWAFRRVEEDGPARRDLAD